MDGQALERMKSGEESWWYDGRRRIVASVLAYIGFSKGERALDFGAGYGAMSDVLALSAGRVFAFEPVPEVVQFVRSHGYVDVYETEDEALASQYDVIGIFDVLEHIEDDKGVLLRIRNALSDAGVLVITVPADMRLWGPHDIQNQHFRRYSRQTLTMVLEEAGYRVSFISYWNSILYPLAFIARVTGNTGESSFALPRLIDRIFYGCLVIESWIMRHMPLAWGVSLIAVAQKNHDKRS